MRTLSVVGFVGMLLTGCSLFTPPLEHPVIEEKLNRGFIDDSSAVGTLSLTPERRIVLVSFKNERFCAEAPTEVGADVSRVLKATADLKTAKQVEAGLGAVVATSLSNAVLNKRTQGMQLFQNSSYFLCQMYMNDAITKEQLVRLQLEALNVSASLIDKEVPLMYSSPGDSTAAKFVPLDINKVLGELLGNEEEPVAAKAKPEESPAGDVKEP
jgi:hypothetical protein